MLSEDALRREEFLSEEELDLVQLSPIERLQVWNAWLAQAQITNEFDVEEYAHGVFLSPAEAREVFARAKVL